MIYNLADEYQRAEFKERANELYKNRCVVELARKVPQRSIRQNKYLHLIISWWAVYYGCSKDYAKRHFFKYHCNKSLFLEKRTAKDGTEYKELRSSTSLNTEEMTTAIQRFRDFCAYQGCYIPSPEEQEYLLFVEREIEKNKEYL